MNSASDVEMYDHGQFFYYQNENNERFPLERMQCYAECGRWVSIAQPFCRLHLREKLHLDVRQSSLPDVGLGVFAYFPGKDGPVFKKNKRICLYGGDILDPDETAIHVAQGRGPYICQVTGNRYEDASTSRGVGSMVNHHEFLRNAHLSRNRAQVLVLVARKDIYHGEEIFIKYGHGYDWRDSETLPNTP